MQVKEAALAYDALIKASRAAREHGFAVVIFTPEELAQAGTRNDKAEDFMISQFNEAFDMTYGEDA